MDLQTLQLAAACALALGYGGYKLAARRGLALPAGLASRSKLAAPRKLLAPSKIRFERVTLDASDADLLYFIRRSATLRRLGFQIVGDFTQKALPGFYHRAFVHPERGFYALLIHAPGKRFAPFVELHTFFDDGSALTTTDAEERDNPKRPPILRMQRLLGLTLDELFSHHLSNTESLRSKVGPSPDASRHAFFWQYQAVLATEAAFTRTRSPLSGQALARILDHLPDVGPTSPETTAILKRYDPLAPVEIKNASAEKAEAPRPAPDLPRPGTSRPAPTAHEPMAPEPKAPEPPELAPATPESMTPESMTPEAVTPEVETPEVVALEAVTPEATDPGPETSRPSLRGIADGLLKRRKAAASAPESPELEIGPIEPPPPETPFEAPVRLPFEPEPASIEASVPRLPFEPEKSPSDAPRLPFEPEASAPARLPFEQDAPEPLPVEEAAQPVLTLPFEKKSEGKPVCPHCGATVLSSLSSRCNKCKLPLR